MAKPHGSVRIGPISLFTLIIILCLSVLAVLSVTTAQAEYSITQRQADTTTETYQLESAGQALVSRVDGVLAGVRQAGSTLNSSSPDLLSAIFADYGIEPKVTSISSSSAPEGGDMILLGGAAPVSAEGEADGGEGQATTPEPREGAADGAEAPAEVTIEEGAEAITDDGMASVVDVEETQVSTVSMEAEGYPNMSCGGTYENRLISAVFTMPSGRTLQVGLRLRDDATYSIVQWKVTTQWIDDGTGENLWLG